MSDDQEIDYSAFLPEPTQLSRTAIVEFDVGPQHFRVLATAATVRKEKWKNGDLVDWLHCKAVPIVKALPSEDEAQSTRAVMIPVVYITSIEPGPAYRIAKGTKTNDIGVFPPEHPTPRGSLGLITVDEAVQRLMTSERN